MKHAIRAALILLLVAVTASAQAWRGQGRLAGKVTGEDKKPIEGVVVKLAMPAEKGAVETKTNAKGEWAVGGLGRGEWQVDFIKPGYETRNISASVAEMTRMPTIEIVLKKAEDPNEIIASEIKRAGDLLTQKQYADARVIYEALLVKYPTAYRLEQLIARTYYLEGRPDKAIERLKTVVARDPDAQEVRLLLGSLLLEQGKADEGRQVLNAVDDAKITEPAIYVNFGIAMLNKNQAAEAITYFEKAIAKFPAAPDAYYYRGITTLQLASAPGEEAQKADRLQRVKADLNKFLQLAPAAPEAETAKKILEQLK
jgi:tetratricopeptide (TPR) repeat protein